MTLLELASDIGLSAHKASSTQGGEYKSACPHCGGKDRFFIQPNKQMKNCIGYYRCRQCDISGDSIQFAIDFKNMAFKEAAQYVNATIPETPLALKLPSPSFKPARLSISSNLWQKKANAFVAWAHENIWDQKGILEILHKRGISADAIRTYKLGWNPYELWRNKNTWGITPNGKRLWITKGIVIPSFDSNEHVIRIKIRRADWKSSDTIGKYIALSGSASGLTIVGDTSKELMIVVESELDAYAIHHAISDFAFVVAIGSNIKNPDNIVDFLAKKKALLICHDNDAGGEAMWKKWKALYPHAHSYPASFGKDIGESIEKGLRVRSWILQYKWNKTIDQELVNDVLNLLEKNGTPQMRRPYEQRILKGPDSSSSKNCQFQKDLLLMRGYFINPLKLY